MAQCPKCSAPVTRDFGVYNCPTCDSVLIVDIAGNVQLDSGPQTPPPPPQIPTSFENDVFAPAPPLSVLTSEIGADISSEIVGVNEVPSPMPDPPPQLLDQPLIANPLQSEDLSEVAQYGNSEVSLAKDGSYLYDILIWNIDSKDLRERLRQAISDSRFGWDPNRIMGAIKSGAVRISEVNAVKAAVLISRIKNLPLGISWEQKIYTEASS